MPGCLTFRHPLPSRVPPWMCEAPIQKATNWSGRSKSFRGLRFSHRGDIFPITLLSSYPSGERTQVVSVSSGAKELEVDADEEPDCCHMKRLIHLPVEGVTFGCSAAHQDPPGERANGHGKKVDDEQCPSKESQLFGVVDPVSEASIRSENSNNWVRERVMGTSMNGLQIVSMPRFNHPRV